MSQEIITAVIVGISVVIAVIGIVRRIRHRGGDCDCGCGCDSSCPLINKCGNADAKNKNRKK